MEKNYNIHEASNGYVLTICNGGEHETQVFMSSGTLLQYLKDLIK